jgi:hypothetical protein
LVPKQIEEIISSVQQNSRQMWFTITCHSFCDSLEERSLKDPNIKQLQEKVMVIALM